MKLIVIIFTVTNIFCEVYSKKLDKFIILIDETLVNLAKNSTYYHKNQLFQGVRAYLTAFKKVLLLYKLGRNKVMKLAKLIYEKKMPLFVSELSKEMQNITANLHINSTECKLLERILEDINVVVSDFRLQCQINPDFVGECPTFDHALLENTENRVLSILKRPRKNDANQLIFFANKYYALLHDLIRKIKSDTYHYIKVEYLYNAKTPTLLKRRINYKKLKERIAFEEGDGEFFEELMTNISTRWTRFMDAYAFKILHRPLTAKPNVTTTRRRRVVLSRKYISEGTFEADEFTLTKTKFVNIYINVSKPTRKKILEYESIDWWEEFLNMTTITTKRPRNLKTRVFGWYRFEK